MKNKMKKLVIALLAVVVVLGGIVINRGPQVPDPEEGSIPAVTEQV